MDSQDQKVVTADPGTIRRAIAAAAMGNCVEWFDFGVYSYVALILGAQLFGAHNQTGAQLASYAALAISFVVRPFGSFVFGPLGDKLGRQRVLATTIILMSGSTFVIGLIPSFATIAWAAPVLVVAARMVQGFSAGGEYGGASTFIAEYAPDRKRGFMCSWLEFGTLGGYVLGAGIYTVLHLTLSSGALNSWGWRIPFLVAGPIGVVGLILRLKLEDTPAFQQLEAAGQKAEKVALRETLVDNIRPVLLCLGVVIVYNLTDYAVLTYMPGYLPSRLHISADTSNIVIIGVMLAMMVVITFVGRLSDRIGRKPIVVTACTGLIVLSIPAFMMMSSKSVGGVTIGLAIMGGLLVLLLGTLPSTLPALFPTRVRYGGFSISYSVSTAVFGGTAPLVITKLISATHNDLVPGFYVTGAALVSIIPFLLIQESARRALRGSPRLDAAPVASPELAASS